jgi:hypothetical protein
VTRSLQTSARTNLLAWSAIVLTATAQMLIGALSLTFTKTVDPWRDPVSDYALHRVARLWFALAVLLVLAGCVALAIAARAAGLPTGRSTTVLFGLWAAGLVVVLVFPGDASMTESTVHGELHRLGGAVLFGSLPLACVALARGLRSVPGWAHAAARLRGCAVAGLLTAAAFGAAQFVPALPAGLLERLALAMELLIVTAAALTIRGASR